MPRTPDAERLAGPLRAGASLGACSAQRWGYYRSITLRGRASLSGIVGRSAAGRKHYACYSRLHELAVTQRPLLYGPYRGRHRGVYAGVHA